MTLVRHYLVSTRECGGPNNADVTGQGMCGLWAERSTELTVSTIAYITANDVSELETL